MNKYSMFYEIPPSEKDEFYEFSGAKKCTFKKGETVMSFSEGKYDTGIVESGLVYLVGVNAGGGKIMLDYYENGGIFGKNFSPNSNVNLYYISARTDCTVNIFEYKYLLSYIINSQYNGILLGNLLFCTVSRAHIHTDILSQKNIREKILSYIKYLCSENSSNTVKLPISLTDFADYISTDRSAMMREIKKMNDEKIILSDGKKFTLLQNPKNFS